VVGRGGGGMSSRSRRRFSKRLGLGLQRMDGAGHVWVDHTRIILGFVFYFVVTPIGIVRRLLGKDPMGRRLRPDLESYRMPRNPRPASHLRRQY
jgi:hypothetical protein